MIYRKWSLLTGPVAILAGIVATVVVADLLFIENGHIPSNVLYLELQDRFFKREERKPDAPSATK
ncbi:hypothetical protein JCGZ_14283 [Jatropha curcas]|uniref:Uncharacterized protein n=1 Tax=Jatropha curcas TaxID=180498 RepID=A0A067JXA0_JATCU|nr:hypothetical protein JCGZ_14283 [Jatropha curcas]